jgi:response regulator RpfG family c-di-GMP phosphodiesterase
MRERVAMYGGEFRAGPGPLARREKPDVVLMAIRMPGMDGIRVVAAGDALLAPRVTRRLIAEFTRRPEPRPGRPAAALDEITGRDAKS